MLEKYRIIKNNNEEILYLFLNVNYEFANESVWSWHRRKMAARADQYSPPCFENSLGGR